MPTNRTTSAMEWYKKTEKGFMQLTMMCTLMNKHLQNCKRNKQINQIFSTQMQDENAKKLGT